MFRCNHVHSLHKELNTHTHPVDKYSNIMYVCDIMGLLPWNPNTLNRAIVCHARVRDTRTTEACLRVAFRTESSVCEAGDWRLCLNSITEINVHFSWTTKWVHFGETIIQHEITFQIFVLEINYFINKFHCFNTKIAGLNSALGLGLLLYVRSSVLCSSV
jgi:hypothetical protein